MMKLINLVINTEEIEQFLFSKLIRKGFVPTEDELEGIADVVFDYFIHKGIIEEDMSEK